MKTIYTKLFFFLLLLPLGVLAQGTLRGTVVDKASGQPIPGVNVVVEGSNNGVSTDFDGKFELTNVKAGETVVFSYIGYKNSIVKFDATTDVTIALEEDANQLQEVVVQVGYGTVRRRDATGAVATVTTEDFNKGANVTVENLLNGRVAGLTINTSGAPGSGSTIRIRGGSSLAASNDPLIVIDGLPITNTTNTGSTSILASLNPNDIESFNILKDASATAIYGSRAANGVIIITTKKGSKKLAVDYNFQYGSGKVVETVDVFNGNDFRNLITSRYPTDTGDATLDATNAGIQALLGDANTDWQDAIYRRTDYVDNNLSVRGSLFGFLPTRLSLGNTYQEGLRLTNRFNRNTISLAMNPSFLNDHLRFRVSANYANERNRFADGVEGSALRMDPTQPIYDANSPYGGFFEYYNPTTGNLLLGARNPVAQLLQTNDTGINDRYYGNVELDYKLHFFPDLRAVINVGFDESNGERTRIVPNNAATGFINADILYGTNEFSKRTLRNKLFDGYLVYNNDFGKLTMEATAGYSYQKFEDVAFITGNINNPDNAAADRQIQTDNVLIGFFGRANFNFNNKYLLTLSYRRDGSSRFLEENRWGDFPAAAFAWKIREDFFAESAMLSDLKLRLGYGITGQQDLPNDANLYVLQQYSIGNPNSQYILGTIPYPVGVPRPFNSLLKWEETTTFNVGVDYGFFNNRLVGAIDLFYKKSADLLSRAALADGSNFSNRGYVNIGDLSSKGIEFSIDAAIVKTEDFNWNVNFNVTSFQRRIDNLALDSDILTGDVGAGTGGTGQIQREGFTPFSFYVYKQLYDTDGTPIEGAYADLDGNGIINGDDRYIYKNPDPDATFGFASNLNYKNLDFSFNLRASVGNRVYNGVNATRANYDLLRDNAVLGNIPTSVQNTGFNTLADVYLSDLFIENASFLRLDNVTLGYTFPNWIENSSLRIYAGVQNVFTWTEYSGLDPEITNDGRDNTIYPRQRSILFGANIKF